MLDQLILGLLALGGLFTFAVLSIRDLRIPQFAFAVMLWGVLIGNKGFATVGVGPIFIMDALLGLAVVGVIVNRTGRRRLAQSRIPWLVLIGLMLIGLVALVRGRSHGMNALMDSILIFYAIAALVPVALFPTIDSARRFVAGLAFPAALGAGLFVALSIAGPTAEGFQSSVVIAWGPLTYTGGTASDNAAAALVLLAALWQKTTVPRVFMGLICASAILISFSRSVWVGLALAGLVLLLISGRDRLRLTRRSVAAGWLAIVVFVFLVAVRAPFATALAAEAESLLFKESNAAVIADDPVGNSKWRITVWSETWDNRIKRNLMFGEGFGRPALEGTSIAATDVLLGTDPRVQVHNGYLTFLLRTGVIGLCFFLAFVLIALQRCVSASRAMTERIDRLFAVGLASAAVVYLVDIGFAVAIESPMVALPFWSLLGVALAVSKGTPRPPAAETPRKPTWGRVSDGHKSRRRQASSTTTRRPVSTRRR